jgi:hypothetical protein
VTIYKGFDLNSAGDPAPWGARETKAFQDIIDTLVSDSLGTLDASGHKHAKVYNGYSNVVIEADNELGFVRFGGDPDEVPGQSFIFSIRDMIYPGFIIEANDTVGQHLELLKITYSNSMDDSITLGASGTELIDVCMKDLYPNAFRLRVGNDDAINVNTLSGNRRLTIGSPGVSNPVVMTPTGDVYTKPWQDITSHCTFLGFLDLDLENRVWIKQLGGLVFVQLSVRGTSDNPFTSIQFPFSMQGACKSYGFYGYDASGIFSVVGAYVDSSNILTTENFMGITTFWQNSGTKGLSGSFVVSVVDPQFTL